MASASSTDVFTPIRFCSAAVTSFAAASRRARMVSTRSPSRWIACASAMSSAREGFATRQLMMYRRPDRFLGASTGARAARAPRRPPWPVPRRSAFCPRGISRPPAAETSLAPVFASCRWEESAKRTRTGQTGRTARRVVPFEGTGGGEGCGETTRADGLGGCTFAREDVRGYVGQGGARRMTDEGKKNVGDDRRRRRGLRRRGVAGGIPGYGPGGGAGASRAGGAFGRGLSRTSRRQPSCAWTRFPVPARARRPCTARSQPPRAGGAGTHQISPLSLSCTPVRPLRRFGVGCEGERGNQRGFKARVGREEARGAPKRARAADAPRDQPPTISTLILRARRVERFEPEILGSRGRATARFLRGSGSARGKRGTRAPRSERGGRT